MLGTNHDPTETRMIDSGSAQSDRPGAHPAGAAAVLDEAALAKLRELDPDGRRGVVTRVLTAFDSSLVRWLAQLAALRDPIDAGVVGGIAHTLKSSAGSVGAKDLARACADIEYRLRSNDPVDLAFEVQHLLTLGHAALVAIRAMLRT
jgi:HPt (histidine-containing phosphotransfer) domain-containing protein